jgi:uncharacterized SAM-binding protein YcdF (DUF218 family)
MLERHRPRPNWSRIGWSLGLLAVGAWVVSLCAVLYFEQRDDARPADAIVVLGAAQYAGHPSPVLKARLDHAIDLWRRGFAPVIIFTGGFGDRDTTSEAAVGQRYAIKAGVPERVILMENAGRNTIESLQQVAVLMASAERSQHRVILVSDPFHMFRLSILARRFGLRPYTSPTRTSPISSNSHERWKYTLVESVKAPVAFFIERR